jgi:hypothetical protein
LFRRLRDCSRQTLPDVRILPHAVPVSISRGRSAGNEFERFDKPADALTDQIG